MSRSSSRRTGNEAPPYQGAIEAAFDDLAQALDSANRHRLDMDRERARAASLKDLIRKLIDMLPTDRRAEYMARLGDRARPDPSTKSGPVFDNVVTLLQQDTSREWTAAEMLAELQDAGVHVDLKSVSNVLGYLARTRQITRVARGLYLMAGGAGLVTSDEIPGAEFGQTRTTEHDV